MMLKQNRLFGNKTEYILMHHDIPVMNFEMNSVGDICSFHIKEIYDANRVPLPCQPLNGELQGKALLRWAYSRVIPEHRSGLTRLFLEFGESDRLALSMINHGVSLTDGYWYRRPSENLAWKDINFHDNKFSYDVGNYIIHESEDINDWVSPDLTTNGRLPKIWRLSPNTKALCLLKGGMPPYYVEPYNELAATQLMNAMDIHIPYVKYSIVKIHNKAYSACDSFLGPNEEYIPASDIVRSAIKPNSMDTRQFLRKRCKDLKIKDYEYFLQKMFLVDYILANTDRHLGNFGFIRNIETLEFIGPAPVFDCGTSLWCNGTAVPELKSRKLEKEVRHFREVIVKMPIKKYKRSEIVSSVESALSMAITDKVAYERVKAIGKTIYEKMSAINDLKVKVKEDYQH